MNVGDSVPSAWGERARYVGACAVRCEDWRGVERDQSCILLLASYVDGGLAVLVQGDDGSPMGKLSVNLGRDPALAGDEFVLHHDMLSLGWAAQVLRTCGGALQDAVWRTDT